MASMQILASNGLLIVEDADTAFEGMLDVGEAPVTATGDVLLVKVQSDADGLVAASVIGSDGETTLPVTVFEGEINLSYGRLRVRDVGAENAIVVGLDDGPCHVRVVVDDAAYPKTVEILVPPL
ncbi:hypothetical protein Aco04nite_16860 [Winogradskya consettensis]|uniref:Uncharacterized protein n=2 Tax=Winogradskya consettensis TaxID=113560 RepID=A0A919SDI7_9ACTN|nr:hypothetical protein Aco04nite_16860 [Actinoplanes consettensis]